MTLELGLESKKASAHGEGCGTVHPTQWKLQEHRSVVPEVTSDWECFVAHGDACVGIMWGSE